MRGALRSLVELAADWYWETDASHAFALCIASSGYDGHSVPSHGTRPWELPGAKAGEAGWDAHRSCIAERRAFRNLEMSYRDATGRRVYVLLSGEPVYTRAGRFRGYRGVARDITAEKRAEQALNASEAQLAAIIDSAMDAVITVNAAGLVVVFNESASVMLRCTRSDAVGRSLAHFAPQALAYLQCADPWDDGRTPAASPRLLVRALPVTARRASGESFGAEATISRLEAAGRELFCIVLRDLSAGIAAEEARRTLETQLRQSQKMEALGTLAGGIAHDFNNIVAAILGNAALASANLDDAASVKRFVTEIGKAGLRARDVVQRIMAFSRKQPPVFTCQPLQPLVQEGVEMLRATLPSGIEVTARLAESPLYADVDAAQISQVLMNLGTNAWQALGSHPGNVRIALDARGAEACLSVTDNGCGMDDATQQRIFEPFFTTKAKGEGTGLGLPVVHGIVRGHGGRIEVRSRRGAGTTFDVYLPLARAPAAIACTPAAGAAAVPRAVAPPCEGRGRHIVYLDDYPAMVFMMKATLEAQGFRVTGFEDAHAALDWLQTHAGDADLLITDYNMPGRSGLEVAADARRLRPELPVVLASGYLTDELRESARALGVTHLFDKPRGIEAMCSLVADVLGEGGRHA
ncbi:hybrid sensor histidine kinase/response regulator [Ramlibacter sp.]|uniref:hybrid sensor histidine kinase/response regulator n=1 Tax=Ramlibacter sp. TaxID=1917967 RepID=UPI003D144FBB